MTHEHARAQALTAKPADPPLQKPSSQPTLRWRGMNSNFQYAGAVNLIIGPFVQPRRRAARTQARIEAMPAACSCHRVGPDAETLCSRCARMSRYPGGSCTTLLTAFTSPIPVSGLQPELPRLGQAGQSCLQVPRRLFSRRVRSTAQRPPALARHDRATPRPRSTATAFGPPIRYAKTVSFSARGTISPVPSIVRPREAPA